MVFVHYAWNEPNSVFITCSVPNPAVAQVCMQWRAIALKVPDLWNRIHLAQPRFWVGVLERFDWDILIFWGIKTVHRDWIKNTSKKFTIPSAAVPKLGRICMISFNVSPKERCKDLRALFDALPSKMSSLTSVDLTSASHVLQQWFSEVNAPNLSEVTLEGIYIDWTLAAARFSDRLVKLCIDQDIIPYNECPWPPPLLRLLTALRNFTALCHLILNDQAVEFDIAPAEIGNGITIMPHLQTLEIFGPADHCTALLANIRPVKLDGFTLRASATSFTYYDLGERFLCIEPEQIRSLWIAANAPLASLGGLSDLSVGLGYRLWIT
jgi:hypothetical protein